MTAFGLLAALAGLSQREASEFLRVRPDTAKSWASGRNGCPPGALAELRWLIARQETVAAETLKIIRRAAPEVFEICCPADDEEARGLGWPCVGAWGAMAARVAAATDIPVMLGARGSTPGTAAAAEARER